MSGGVFHSQVTTSHSRKKPHVQVNEYAFAVLRRKMEEAAKLSGWENPPVVTISNAERKVGEASDEATFTRWLANRLQILSRVHCHQGTAICTSFHRSIRSLKTVFGSKR
ncbi:hypothetical protein O6H91_Y251400 [Diphasiastrum complanatum]|nr:hypothetical protein O6H91_Y251400 [Diphasiastrum complanatum]